MYTLTAFKLEKLRMVYYLGSIHTVAIHIHLSANEPLFYLIKISAVYPVTDLTAIGMLYHELH